MIRALNLTTLAIVLLIIAAFAIPPTVDRHLEPLVRMMEMSSDSDATIDVYAAWVRPNGGCR